MKRIFFLALVGLLILSGCKTKKEAQRQQKRLEKYEANKSTKGDSNTAISDGDVNVKFENVKILDIGQYLDPKYDYFVIIGSFRSLDNLEKYKEQLKIDGFDTFNILRNDEGLYRISVLETNDEEVARTKIKAIRTFQSRYADVWLLKDEK